MLNRKIKNQLNDSFFDNINGCSLDMSQRKVVLDENDSLLVIAGAGSGKTITIIGKIRYLIERKNIDYRDILCISFTNETVNNLKKKIGYDVDCYTFHKLALRILRENNFSYQIIDPNFLAYIIDEYFEYNIYNNNYMKYVLEYFNILLKKNVSYNDLHGLYYKQFLLYKRMILSFINRCKCNNHHYYDWCDYLVKNKRYSKEKQEQHKCLLIIIFDIYRIYKEELNASYSVDFDSMINEAIKIVDEKGVYHHYKYIIIDEYQDTSFIRYQLIKKIILKTNAKIMCVGDDYQSIYAFSGCNLDLFVNFKRYFNNAKIMFINKTYRNCYGVVNTSCKFIKKNPYQLRKEIKANFLLKKPFKIIYYNQDYVEKFYKLLDRLIDEGKRKILVLGRNNDDILHLVPDIKGNTFVYRYCKIKYLTVHRSKGLEEDNVIIINCNDDYLGFPNKIIDNEIFDLITKNNEKISFAEERRLFYVALTRTKNYVYIMSKKNKVSTFVMEIINKIEEVNL